MSAYGRMDTNTHTKVKTVYPPVSLRSLGRYTGNTNANAVLKVVKHMLLPLRHLSE